MTGIVLPLPLSRWLVCLLALWLRWLVCFCVLLARRFRCPSSMHSIGSTSPVRVWHRFGSRSLSLSGLSVSVSFWLGSVPVRTALGSLALYSLIQAFVVCGSSFWQQWF